MTEHNNQLSIDGKRVVSKVVNDKGSTQEITQAELRRHEEANIEED